MKAKFSVADKKQNMAPEFNKKLFNDIKNLA